jgi:hypothetical protein
LKRTPRKDVFDAAIWLIRDIDLNQIGRRVVVETWLPRIGETEWSFIVGPSRILIVWPDGFWLFTQL